MAQFIGIVQGSRGEATRLGTRNSGIVVRAQGWNLGVRVIGSVDENGEDVFTVQATSGSHDSWSPRDIGTLKMIDGEAVLELPHSGIRFEDPHK